MTTSAAVVGASGYAGVELLRLLAHHSEFTVVAATAQRSVGTAVAALAPGLAPVYPELQFVASDDAAVAHADVVFLAMPHGASQELVANLANPLVIDLAADFRLDADEYAHWYEAVHRAPNLVPEFVCGLPELFRSDLVGARRIAAPGCYPTAATLALAPLVASGIIGSGIVVNALSGVSGRGRALSDGSLFSEVNESAHAYGLATHRHTPEIERMLGTLAPAPVVVQFTPHLVPMTRGIVATCTAPLDTLGQSPSLSEIAMEFFADAPFVTVASEPVPTKAVAGTNRAAVTYRADTRTGNAVATCTIDNLVKGTAGQAIQAANVALGFPEGTGLDALAVWP